MSKTGIEKVVDRITEGPKQKKKGLLRRFVPFNQPATQITMGRTNIIGGVFLILLLTMLPGALESQDEAQTEPEHIEVQEEVAQEPGEIVPKEYNPQTFNYENPEGIYWNQFQ